jgi:beta-phosphoglucomutase
VSGTPLSEIKAILPQKIHRLFDLTVAGDQIKEGKPNPEPYLTAARILRINPKDCVVVENSPFGITSAKRAGMFCIALTTSLPKEYLKKADMVVDRLEEIIPFVEHSCHL